MRFGIIKLNKHLIGLITGQTHLKKLNHSLHDAKGINWLL